MTNIAIAGVGNCASALVQGIEADEKPDPLFSGLEKSEINFVAGFDVHAGKVGSDISEAIFQEPNCANKITDVGNKNAPVFKGSVLDGLDSDIADHIPVDTNQEPVSVSKKLKEADADILIILLPTGSQEAAEYYAHEALEAGCAVINGMPASIANNQAISQKARKKNLPVIGDDIKSQIGATIIHRALTKLFPMRGAKLDSTIQLDWGGDMDFCNLMSNGRYEHGKRQSKTESVLSVLPDSEDVDAKVSAVDYIPFLENQKEAYTRLQGKIFGGQPVRIDVNMEVQDAYNSAGMLLGCIYACDNALKRNRGGVLESASAFFCKKPPIQMDYAESVKDLRSFLNRDLLTDNKIEKRRQEERDKYTEWYYKNEYWKEDDPDTSTERFSYEDPGHEKRFDFLYEVITSHFEFDTFLDVGCGTGKLLRKLLDNGYEGKGIEVSDAALEKYLDDFVSEGIVKEGGAENIPFPENNFDAVICLDVMEHLPSFDVDRAIQELVRVCDQYLILTINLDNPYEYHPTIMNREEWEGRFLASGKVEQLNEVEEEIQSKSDDERPEYEWFVFEKVAEY